MLVFWLCIDATMAISLGVNIKTYKSVQRQKISVSFCSLLVAFCSLVIARHFFACRNRYLNLFETLILKRNIVFPLMFVKSYKTSLVVPTQVSSLKPELFHQFVQIFLIRKQLSRGVLGKQCSENMQQVYRRTPMSKCDFNKVAL